MKQKKLVDAYNVIKSMNSSKMKGVSLSTQLKMFNLQKQLAPAYDFQVEKEKELFTEFPPTRVDKAGLVYEKEDGSPDFEKVKICRQRVDELNELENESIKIEPIHISMKEAEVLTSDSDSNIIEILDGILIIDNEPVEELQLTLDE